MGTDLRWYIRTILHKKTMLNWRNTTGRKSLVWIKSVYWWQGYEVELEKVFWLLILGFMCFELLPDFSRFHLGYHGIHIEKKYYNYHPPDITLCTYQVAISIKVVSDSCTIQSNWWHNNNHPRLNITAVNETLTAFVHAGWYYITSLDKSQARHWNQDKQ